MTNQYQPNALSFEAKLWCAACGKWGDHQSGSCPEILHPKITPKEWIEAYNKIRVECDALRKENASLRHEASLLQEKLSRLEYEEMRRNS